MAAQWYYRNGSSQFGPITAAQLKRLALERRLLPEHLVRKGEKSAWVSASKVKGLFEPFVAVDDEPDFVLAEVAKPVPS